MDLNSKAHYMLVDAWNSVGDFAEHRRILERLGPLTKRHDHETLEMWCSRICDPFRKILKENYFREILSKVRICGTITQKAYAILIKDADRLRFNSGQN